MNAHAFESRRGLPDEYLIGKGQAWFAFVMTIGLMLVDYIDRQVIVSLFPYMKAEWDLSDKQLGALVSVVSVTVAIGALPVALLADRYSRVKSIVAMATIWSLATISCMFTRSYSQLFAARAFVGLGEAGYGSVGAALIASVFPARMRSALLAAFFAAASVGSVLGVMLGGLIAAKWGWKAAFGVVGIPGLLLALLYLKVRDYRTVDLTPELNQATKSTASTAKFIAKALVRSPTMLWVCLGGAAQLVVVSAILVTSGGARAARTRPHCNHGALRRRTGIAPNRGARATPRVPDSEFWTRRGAFLDSAASRSLQNLRVPVMDRNPAPPNARRRSM